MREAWTLYRAERFDETGKNHHNVVSDPQAHRNEDKWQEKFDLLVAFKKKHGHCNVPKKEMESCAVG